jgi:hypothetical protein
MRLLIAGAVLGAVTVSAQAADLPVKAPAISTSFPIASSGVYYGLYTAGAAGSADAKNLPAGVNTADLTTTQGEVGGVVGYRFGSSNMARFIDIEADLGWMNLNGNTSGLSLSGPVAAEVGARIGVPAAAITALFPSFSLPSFPLPPPTGVAVLGTQLYLGGAARFEDVSVNFGLPNNQAWTISPAIWVGGLQQLSNGTALDARFEYIAPSSACVGPVMCATLGHRYMAKAAILF